MQGHFHTLRSPGRDQGAALNTINLQFCRMFARAANFRFQVVSVSFSDRDLFVGDGYSFLDSFQDFGEMIARCAFSSFAPLAGPQSSKPISSGLAPCRICFRRPATSTAARMHLAAIACPFLIDGVGRATALLSIFSLLFIGSILWILQRMHGSVGVESPTQLQLDEEDLSQHALFDHVPELKSNLAWRQLGNFPTPIHRGCCTARPTNCTKEGQSVEVSFYLKREDLSSPFYGGNKVRTLQHQLAVVEAKCERSLVPRELVVVGSGGSNQVVATLVHAMKLKLHTPINAVWVSDPPDLDNTLNMLSALSLPLNTCATWSQPWKSTRLVLASLLSGSRFVLPIGGNNPAGVLGQVSGALELAEQIAAGQMPDCDGIYVAVGSSCTVSGLIIGVALARKCNIKAFAKRDFALHMVPIDGSMAALHRSFGIYKAKWSRCVPLTVRHSIHSACRELHRLGGPDVLEDALRVLEAETIVHDDKNIVGRYGVHSGASKAAARLFDSTCQVTTSAGTAAPVPWLCGHFVAKAFAVMCDDLIRQGENGSNEDDNNLKTMLLWQTKSAIQPRGPEDEWTRMLAMPRGVQAWASEGQAQSELRAGHVSVPAGAPSDYRQLMTDIS